MSVFNFQYQVKRLSWKNVADMTFLCGDSHVCVYAQLFKKPHPQKKLSLRGGLPAAATQLGFFVSSAANDRLFFHNLDNLRPSMQALKGKQLNIAVCYMCLW